MASIRIDDLTGEPDVGRNREGLRLYAPAGGGFVTLERREGNAGRGDQSLKKR